MSRPLLCLLYLNGTITEGPNGIKFEGTRPKGLRISHGISYNELIGKIHQVLELDFDHKICKLVHRLPIAVQAAQMNCVPFELTNDDDVEMMLETHIGHGVLIGMEINVEIESTTTVSLPSYQEPEMQSMLNPFSQFDSQYGGFGLYTQMLMNAGVSTSLPLSGLPSPVTTSYETPTVDVADRPSCSTPNFGLEDRGIGELAQSLDRMAVAVSPPTSNNLYFSGLGTEDEEPISSDDGSDHEEDDHIQLDINDIGPSHGSMGAAADVDIHPMDHLSMPQSRGFGQIDWHAVDVSQAQAFDIIWPTNWDPNQELDKGMLFRKKADVQMAVRLYSLRRHQECIVIESEPSL